MLSFVRSSTSGLRVLLTSQIKSTLIVLSALPAAGLSLFLVILLPDFTGTSPIDILFWGVLALSEIVILIIAGTINYRLIILNGDAKPRKTWYIYHAKKTPKNIRTNRRIVIVWAESLIATIILIHVALHITNPYAMLNVVQQPYVTRVVNGVITVDQKFRLHTTNGPFASALGYYKSGFLIVQNAWFGSHPAPSHDVTGIVNDIHALRFDPSKPYLISGDQFSVLYPRNLGVFYNSLLDDRTVHSQNDWENRQRLYLQSALYAIDAFSSAKQITTTIVPISPQGVVLTEVHPGSIASDSLYGILYALDQLEYAPHVQTSATTKELVRERKVDLSLLLTIYLKNVQDQSSGLIKRGIQLASARDGVVRDSSFYDNVILWKTLELANTLGIRSVHKGELSTLHEKIMKTFWQEKAGYFRDDRKTSDYSSDWLIAMPTGFLSVNNPQDRTKIAEMISYIKSQKLDQPFPIRYSLSSKNSDIPLAVRKFAPNYGGDAIWSYWGAQYIDLLAVMYGKTSDATYKNDAENFIRIYKDKILQTRGFPETFDTDGNFLEYPFYKSIRQTGWVVQFEQAEVDLDNFSSK